MNFDVVLLHDASLNKEIGNILPLVTLKLNDLSKLRVLDNSTIAAELLLEVLQYLVVAELLLEALHSGQALASVPLLYADVDVLLNARSRPRVLSICLCKRIEGSWDLDVEIRHELLALKNPRDLWTELCSLVQTCAYADRGD